MRDEEIGIGREDSEGKGEPRAVSFVDARRPCREAEEGVPLAKREERVGVEGCGMVDDVEGREWCWCAWRGFGVGLCVES